MHHIHRIRSVKYDLSRFSPAELRTAVEHARHALEAQQGFLAALLLEQEVRSAADRARGAGIAPARPPQAA